MKKIESHTIESSMDFLKKIRNAKSKLVVIEFFSDASVIHGPVVENLQKSMAPFKTQIIYLKVNADLATDLTRRYRVLTTPTIIFLKNYKVVDKVVRNDPEKFQEIFDQYCDSDIIEEETSSTNNIFKYKSISSCKRNEYYDLDYFTCLTCGKNLIGSENKFDCVCPREIATNILFDTFEYQPICVSKCNKTCVIDYIPRSIPDNSIDCKIKYVREIVRSARNITVKSLQIVQPPEYQIENETNCNECDLGANFLYENYCIESSILKNYLNYNAFGNWGIYANLKFTALFCRTFKNATACNHLANLCVASFYSLDKNSPCSIFILAQTTEYASVYSDEDLKDIKPFIFYKKAEKSTIQEIEKTIDYSYSLDGKSQESFLQFYTTTYSLDGKLQRMGLISPNDLSLCNQFSLPEHHNFKFGKNFLIKCKFNLRNLINLGEIMGNKNFINLFLNYSIGKQEYLQSVPILIRNAFSNDLNTKLENWQLVKRFQLIETLPRLHHERYSPIYEDAYKVQIFRSIRFVNDILIECSIRDNNKISIPIIKINYENVDISSNSSLDTMYGFNFKMNFIKEQFLNYWFEILLPLFLCIGFALALLRTYNFKTRQNKEFYDLSAFFQFTLYLFSYFANAFFLIAAIVAIHCFLVFTTQKIVSIMLPIEQSNNIEILIYFALVLKSIYLFFHFWRIIKVDLCFIDWERPRANDVHFNFKGNCDTPSVCSSARSYNENSVSAWRIFFVANEWIQLCKRRKISITFQCLLMWIFMSIIQEKSSKLTEDRIIHFAIVIILYTTIYLSQRLLNYIFCQIFGNPLQRFIDICSLANISVMILLQDSYGFYIHGRSPHGFSDTDMSSMILQLQRESHNMCGKRGLLIGSDQQTYTILAPTLLRSYYGKLLMPFLKSVNISQVHYEKEFSSHKVFDCTLEKTTVAYSSVNRFFCAFIDHAIKDLDYILKEKNIIEKILDCEFDNYLTENKGTFYIDNNFSFSRVFLYGNEFQLFLFEIILISTIFLATGNILIAIFIMCLVQKLIKKIFCSKMKSNLSAKTLIDRRFLL
ncbi:meckelin [Condylostylus longicornis]|uniref:meckelin n=1 Tax=Condylostylus longicornis TaxID=2530218 RepID=UPI00244D994F|nr:meckelin [Condylostylus longicornis]